MDDLREVETADHQHIRDLGAVIPLPIPRIETASREIRSQNARGRVVPNFTPSHPRTDESQVSCLFVALTSLKFLQGVAFRPEFRVYLRQPIETSVVQNEVCIEMTGIGQEYDIVTSLPRTVALW